jgi:hypothetical protein
MSGGIYLLNNNGKLFEMKEEYYDSEKLLQDLIAEYPNLLAGDQINKASPRKWLLIRKEVPLYAEEGSSGGWAIDHLFLDQDAIPTIIEVKRSTDTRIRREVVGQMLDYASNAAVYWSIDKIKAYFEANCQNNKKNPDEVLKEFLDELTDADEFWQKVKTNLQAGKVRLVFISDNIPYELQRIVEFLNEQMDPAEVLAIEIRQYTEGKLKALVPRVIGQTSEAQKKKVSSEPGEKWNEEKFVKNIEENCKDNEIELVKGILNWSKDRNLEEWWGSGKVYGTFFPVLIYRGKRYTLFSIWTNKYIEIEFNTLNSRLPNGNEEILNQLLNRLNELKNVNLPADTIKKLPSIRFDVLIQNENKEKFIKIFDWLIEEIKKFIDKKQIL